jgi:glycerol-3-phosphate acyltransferase PlsY
MFVVSAVIAYFLGGINGAILVSKYFYHDDVRTHGSGNAGLTNFYRVYGTKGIAGVLACDILKGMAGAFIGGVLVSLAGGPELCLAGQFISGAFVLLGHMFPVMFNFHGGKGILSAVSAVLVINWKMALLLFAIFLVIVVITKYVSLGSIVAALLLLPFTWLWYRTGTSVLLALPSTALLVYGHRSNIVRLIHGKESRFTLHKNKTEGGK